MVHQPLRFLLDRCLGTKAVPDAMRAKLADGEGLVCLDSLFSQTTTDLVWLTAVAAGGYVIVTKDGAIRRNPLEKQALLAAQTAAFFLGNGSATGSKMGDALALAMPAMRAAVRRFAVPILGRVTLAGEVAILHDGGVDHSPAKPVRVKRHGAP